MRKLLLSIFLSLIFFCANAASTLAPGDIAVIRMNQSGVDGFSIVTLVPLELGTTMYITEQGWRGASSKWCNNTEVHVQFSTAQAYPAGTVFHFDEETADVLAMRVNNGTTVTNYSAPGFNYAGGDQVIVYQGSLASPVFITGFTNDNGGSLTTYGFGNDAVTKWATEANVGDDGRLDGAQTSRIPTGLTNGTNAISMYWQGETELSNNRYNGVLTGTKAEMMAALNNRSNWTADPSTGYGRNTVGNASGSFTITVAGVALSTNPTLTFSNATGFSDNIAEDGEGGSTTITDINIQTLPINSSGVKLTADPLSFFNGSSPGWNGYPALISYGDTNAFYGWSIKSSDGSNFSFAAIDFLDWGNQNGATFKIEAFDGGVSKGSLSFTGNTNSTFIPLSQTASNSSFKLPASFGNVDEVRIYQADGGNSFISLNGINVGSPVATPVPVVTGNQPNRTLCLAGSTTLPITATGATSYQWQVNTGSSFTDIVNGGVYSNATTSTLSLTGVTAGMSGYLYRCRVTNSGGSVNSNQSTLTVINITVAGTSQTNIGCKGASTGVASVSGVSGGIAPYTYSWSPSGGTAATASGLAAGTYTVTITDNIGCTTTRSFTITEPTVALSGSISAQTNNSVFGGTSGSATVTAAGGTPGYTYSWSPSGGTAATASGLAAGTYTVTITDANSCTTTASVTITQPTLVLSPLSQTNIACKGASTGSATVVVTSGTGPYTYSWSPSGGTAATATGLAAGTYTVTVTGTSGTATQSFTITEPVAELSATSSVVTVSCNGGSNGSATINPSGGTAPYTYLWSTGATTKTISGLLAGYYTYTVTDANGCSKNYNAAPFGPGAGAVVTQPSLLRTNVGGSQTNILCYGSATGSATVAPTGGTGSYTYSWSPSGGTAATASGLAAGTYTVTVTDANSCTSQRTYIITQPTAALVATAGAQTNILCNGSTNGSATVSATGGTGPYTYSWSPSGGTAATATGLTAGTYTVTVTDANGCTATQSFTLTEPSLLLAMPLSQTNIACNGGSTGSATVTATGGTGAYTYSWSPSGGTAATASGLTAGTYTVTVTDANGCTATQSFTISQPPVLTAAAGAMTSVSCNGGTNGSATVSASGGTPGYTYSWAPSGGTAATASGLAAGTYTVTVTDANGCTATQSFTITQPPVLTATAGTTTNVSCNGGTNGSATVTASGGTPGYTYSWSPSGGTAATASGLSAGTYTVTVTDANGCTATQSFTITEPPVLVASASAQTNIACNGSATGSATVAVSGGTGAYTYSWSPSGGTAATASGLTAGTYTVTVTDANGCTATQSFTITQPAVLVATAGATTNVSCNGGSNGSATVSASGGTAGYTYSWSPSGGTAATASGLTSGTYTVTVTDANGCTATQSFTITQPAVLAATAGAKTNVSCNGGTNGSATVSVMGGTGAYTYSWSPTGGTAATASGLTSGTYTVTVTDANGCTTTQSFTITQPPVLTATAGAQTNILCNGGTNGSATVSVTGGTAGYTYSWAPSGGTAATATGLAAGTYTVTVTDANGCTTTQSFTITQPPVLTATAGGQTNILCNGSATGSATVSASGGTPGYTYSWAPSGGTAATATGLTAGTYTVTVTDANGCTATQSFTLTQPSALTATAGTRINVSCNGGSNGSATVNVTGGTGAYTYSWSPSGGTAATASGLAAGTYTVTVTDANSCTTTQSFTIAQPAVLVATAGTTTNVSCNGGSNGSATVNVSGGTAAYSYSWAPSGGTAATATGLAAGTYTVTVTDANGCTATQSFTITQPSAVALSGAALSGGKVGVSYSQTVAATGASGSYTYTSGALPSGLTLAANGTISGIPATAGSFNISITATDNTCSSVSATASFSINIIKGDQAITFAALSDRTYGDAPFGLTATGGASGIAVAYTSSNPLVATISGSTVTIVGKGTTTITAAQAGNANYNAATSVPRDLTITARAVTVTATARTKAYGDADPALIYTFVPALATGDSFTGSLSRASGQNVGSYAINQGTLALNANYALSYVPANLAITARAVTVTATAGTKTYGDIEPPLVYTFGPALVAGDSFSGALSRQVGDDAGVYVIGQGNLSAGGNYQLSYVPANFTILARSIRVTATARTKSYGSADPALTYTFSPSPIFGDTFSGTLSRAAGENIGAYAIGQGTLTLGSNYILDYTAAELTIGRAPLAITAEDKEKFVGMANPVLTVRYTGFVNGETAAVLTAPVSLATTATTGSPVGTYNIVPSGATAANYQISFVNGTLRVKTGAPSDIVLSGAALYENRPAGTAAGTLGSTSADPSATFSYALVQGAGDSDNGLFSITGNSLSTTSSLDFENRASYSIRIRSTTQLGFSLEKAITITIGDVNEAPTLNAISGQSICTTTAVQNIAISGISGGPESAQSTTLTVASSNDALFQGLTVVHNGSTGSISYQPVAGAVGTATITVTVRDNGGTVNGGTDTYTRTFTIAINALPVVAISANKPTTVARGEQVVLTASGGTSYIWANASGIISGQNTAVLTIRPTQNTTYTVTATNAGGCSDTRSITISVSDQVVELKPTNIMSPNGDGVNDRWIVENLELYPNNQVKVFDRGGREIYSKKGYDNSWDATLRGLPLAEGTYYYVIDYNGDGKTLKKGFITILNKN